jgi:hypothetical protein
MAAISLSASSLKQLKDALRKNFDEEKSSHLTEAMACALGFNTHAALLASVSTNASDPPVVDLDTKSFADRLASFGYPRDDEFDFEWLSDKDGPVIPTVPLSAYEVEYKSNRAKAWRNVLVCAVNAAIEKKLISVRPGDNRWPGAVAESGHGGGPLPGAEDTLFDFQLPNGLPARVYLRNIGWDELSIHVAVNPVGDILKAFNAGFDAGDVFAAGWLERQRGAWLQTAKNLFSCRRHLTPVLAALDVKPLGYGDRGGVIM